MFFVALFTIAKLWNYGNSPDALQLMNELRKCAIHIYKMEFYSAIKRNEILSLAGKWIELQNIMSSDTGQVQKDKSHVYSLIWGR
jgi:hypothetical protein